MKNKKKCRFASHHSLLWLHYTLLTFSLLTLTAIIMVAVSIFLFRHGLIDTTKQHPLVPIVLILAFSVVLGTILSGGIANTILKPIVNFTKALDEVAKGNFKIKLDENVHPKELRELNKNFNLMTKELSSIETLRNDFTVNVSHEFKTPLAAIEGYATLLQDDNLEPFEIQDYTQMIIQSTQQLNHLTGNILQLSKLENNTLPLESTSFRLDEQIRQAIVLLEPSWSEKELHLKIDLPKVVYTGHASLLMQVWLNLINNAIKFSDKQTIISISMIANEQTITIFIEDSGIGMSEKTLKKAFEKFYQGDTMRHTTGNGLGLALVKQIITLSKGEIQIESQEQVGTKFIITLPHTKSASPTV